MRLPLHVLHLSEGAAVDVVGGDAVVLAAHLLYRYHLTPLQKQVQIAHDWYFIAACQVHRPFKDLIFPSLCSRVHGLFVHIRFVVLSFYSIFLLGSFFSAV